MHAPSQCTMKKGNVPLDSFCGNASVVESATHDSTEGESCVEADLGIDFLHSVSELRKLLDRLALSHENEDYLASLQSDMRTIALSCSPAQVHFKLAEHLKLCIREKNGCVINRKLPAPQITFDPKDFLLSPTFLRSPSVVTGKTSLKSRVLVQEALEKFFWSLIS